MSRCVRDSWAMLFRILPSFMDIVALDTMTVFLCAIVGNVVFDGSDPCTQRGGVLEQ
jgi:hypothetical protein